MAEEITGISFIDNAIARKGFQYFMKCLGWLFVIGGLFSLIGSFNACFISSYMTQVISKWIQLGLAWPAYYNISNGLIFGPLDILIGLGFIKMKDWSRKLLLIIIFYKIFETIIIQTLLVLKMFSQVPDKINWLSIIIFKLIFSLSCYASAICIFSRPKVKEQFK
jgi:hypothetical protein